MAENNLKIIAFGKPKDSDPSKEKTEFMVDYNPNTFTINNKIEYEPSKEKGQTGGDPVFKQIPPLEFSLEFVIDGTGAAAANFPKKNKSDLDSQKNDYVKTQIKNLRNVTGSEINGEIHRPNYLAVLWGTFHIECVITALNITYNLFDRDGSPLRAKVNCSFTERIGPGKGGRQSRLESTDLTRYVTVKEGDTLPLITRDHYDDSAFYMQVAKANKLKNFRNLVPGTTLILPPIANNDE